MLGVNRRRLVRVPASSANLGPGYDVLAAALVAAARAGGRGDRGVLGRVRRAGRSARPLQPLRPRLRAPAPGRRRDVPRSGRRSRWRPGSARAPRRSWRASCAADHMYELDAPLFELAAELEGHPDNVAAALLGGFVMLLRRPSPSASIRRPAWRASSRSRPARCPTAEARAALPAEVPIADAVHNVGARVAARARAGRRRPVADRRAACATGCTSRAGRRSTRARWSWSSGAASSAPWARRSPAPARPCCSGATGSRPGRWSSGCAREAPDCEVRRVPFAPGGADVKEL